MGDNMTNQEAIKIVEYIIESIIDELISKAVTYEFPDYDSVPIDNNEHMWYNTFNKWSWTKFENGVIKIENDERRV